MVDVKLKICELISQINNSKEDYVETQKNSLKIIGEISDSDHKKIFTYTADELGINKFPDEWPLHLLETQLFNTYTGGDRFFIILKEAIINKDRDLIFICTCALNLGFKSKHDGIAEDYLACIKFLQLKPFSSEYILPKSRINHIESSNFSLIKIFAPFIIGFTFISIYEAIRIFLLSKDIYYLSEILGGVI